MTEETKKAMRKLERTINRLLLLNKIYMKQRLRDRIKQLDNELSYNRNIIKNHYKKNNYDKSQKQVIEMVIKFPKSRKEYFEDYKKETKRVRKIYLFNHMKKNHNFTGKKRLRVS